MTFRRLFVVCAALCLFTLAWSGVASAHQQTTETPESTSTVATSATVDEGTPIPVEPDGGIGDGAGPIPTTDDGGLAYTGSDSVAIAFLGAGMIIVGATAVATAQSWRRR